LCSSYFINRKKIDGGRGPHNPTTAAMPVKVSSNAINLSVKDAAVTLTVFFCTVTLLSPFIFLSYLFVV